MMMKRFLYYTRSIICIFKNIVLIIINRGWVSSCEYIVCLAVVGILAVGINCKMFKKLRYYTRLIICKFKDIVLIMIARVKVMSLYHLARLAVGVVLVVLFYYYYYIVLNGIACIALTALIACLAILFLILRINYIKNNPNKYVYSKYGFLLFKADWINIQIITIFKFISIYFVNINTATGQLGFNKLLIILSGFYILLNILASDTFINRMYNIQQGLILIIKSFDDLFAGAPGGVDANVCGSTEGEGLPEVSTSSPEPSPSIEDEGLSPQPTMSASPDVPETGGVGPNNSNKYILNNRVTLGGSLKFLKQSAVGNGLGREVQFKRYYSTQNEQKFVNNNIIDKNNISIFREFKNDNILNILNKYNFDTNIISEIDQNLLRFVAVLEIIKKRFKYSRIILDKTREPRA